MKNKKVFIESQTFFKKIQKKNFARKRLKKFAQNINASENIDTKTKKAVQGRQESFRGRDVLTYLEKNARMRLESRINARKLLDAIDAEIMEDAKKHQSGVGH